MVDTRKAEAIGLLFGLAIGIVLGWFVTQVYFTSNPVTITQEKIVTQIQKEVQEENRSLVLWLTSSWGESTEPGKIIFSGWVDNFGKTEAKNVTIYCKITKDGTTLQSFEHNAGNVASQSYKYLDFTKPYIIPEGVVSTCYIKSCENCVNLVDSIPELKI